MPEDELIHFKNCIDYLESFSSFANVIITFTPTKQPYNNVLNFICIRKVDNYNIPYMTYILASGNFMYQIIVPSFCKDNLKSQLIPRIFPSPYSIGYSPSEIIKSKIFISDLSGVEPTTKTYVFRAVYNK